MALPIQAFITDAAGNPINGAKIYTYEGGTLSPKAVYTTSALTVAHPNPIIAANGKATYFLGTGAYRIRVTDAADVDLPAYAVDNISAEAAAGSSPTSTSVAREAFTAADGQTIFTLLSTVYTQGNNSLRVYLNGRKLPAEDYTETSPTSFTLKAGALAGQVVEAEVGTAVTTGFASSQASYLPAGSGAVASDVQSKLREFPSVLDFGADETGVADSTAAFNLATANPVIIPAGTYRTNTAPTAPTSAVVLGATFTGSAPWDSWIPAFGASSMEVVATGNRNAFVGAVRNTLAPGSLSFPTGVTGFARNDNAGNTAFGLYGEARQHATSGVVVGAELDSFNMTGTAPTVTTTPDRSIGTAQQLPNAVTIGAGGTAASWCGAHFVREGSAPQPFLYGAIFDANAVTESAIVIEAGATTGPTLPLLVKHKTTSIAAQFQAVGTAVPDNAVVTVVDPAAATVFSVRQNGRLAFTSAITQTTVGAAGGASALPATPTGYLRLLVGATQFVIPYYAA